MTSTTLSWKHGLDRATAAQDTEQPTTAQAAVASDRKSSLATRWLGGVLLAAIVAATMVGASSLLAGEGQTVGGLTWVALWMVGFVTLMIFARAAFGVAGAIHARWTLHRKNTGWLRTQREIMRAAQQDPRLWRELQIMQDKSEWTS